MFGLLLTNHSGALGRYGCFFFFTYKIETKRHENYF